MSIDLHEENAGRLLSVHLTGKLHADDYKHFVPAVEQAVRQHDKICMLVEMRDFHGWTAGAIWEDIKFDARHFNHIERLAIVGDKKWEQWMATFCRPFTTAIIRYFTMEQMDEAKEWLTSSDKPATQPPAQ